MEKQDTQTQENQEKPTISRLRRPNLLAIGVLLSLSVSGFTAYQVMAASSYHVAGTQSFSIGTALSFASTSNQTLLLPGATGTIHITIVSALPAATSVTLMFNSTDTTDWGWSGNTPGGFCSPFGTLIMSIGSQQFLPINDPSGGSQGCGTVPNTATLSVSPGNNSFNAIITVSPAAAISTAFSINWSATNP